VSSYKQIMCRKLYQKLVDSDVSCVEQLKVYGVLNINKYPKLDHKRKQTR